MKVTDSDQPRLEEIPQINYASYISKNAIGGGGAASGVPVFVMKTGTPLRSGKLHQDGRINYKLFSGANGDDYSTDCGFDWSTTTRCE